MSKFKVLNITKVLKSRIGLYTYRLSDPNNEFSKAPGCCYVIFSLASFHVISSALFVSKSLSEFTTMLATSLMIIAGLQGLGLLLSVAFNMDKVKELHRTLQEIVDGKTYGITIPCIIITIALF